MNESVFHLFKTYKNNYIYDVNTNVLMTVSDEYAKRIVEYKNTGKLNCVVKKLQEQGYLRARNNFVMEHPETEGLEYILENNLNTMALQLTQNCNLRCKYCVYSGNYENRKHSSLKMNKEIAYRAIDFFVRHSSDSEKLHLGFYGGEPLLEFELIKGCVEYIKKIANKEVIFNITTNCVLLDESKIDFLYKNRFRLTISLDGPQEIHDANRVKRDDSGSFANVINAIKIIKQKYPDYLRDVNINAVLDVSKEFKSVYDFFCMDDQIYDIYATYNFQTDDYVIHKKEMSEAFKNQYMLEQLKYIMAMLEKKDIYSKSNIFDSYIKQLIERVHKVIRYKSCEISKTHPGGPCVPGKHRFFVNAEGYFYPCERVNELSPVMQIGNLETGFELEKVENLLNIGKLTDEECRKCWAFRFCTICAAKADEGGELSRTKKLENCKIVKETIDSLLYDYCMLRELGFDFDYDYEME